jgi:segregation and condensation protein A
MSYHVRLDQFEGPLDLLLSLVEREELRIAEVSLAQVTDQFLAYLEEHQDLPLEQLSGFLSVAAKLLLIKSRALLPSLSFTAEEEAEINDLTDQLAEYQRFRDAAVRLGALFGEQQPSYARESFAGIRVTALPPENLTGDALATTFRHLQKALPEAEVLAEETVHDIIRMEDKIREFQEHIARRAETSFAALVGESRDRMVVVVSFLAVLELVKRKILVVHQPEYFGDIAIRSHAAVVTIDQPR